MTNNFDLKRLSMAHFKVAAKHFTTEAFWSHCNGCSKTVDTGFHGDKSNKECEEIFEKQIAFLKRLKVDDYWLDAFKCDKGEYYIFCMNCWLKILRTATATTVIGR